MNENKRQPCELIRDLMPLCHDGVASDASRVSLVGKALRNLSGVLVSKIDSH